MKNMFVKGIVLGCLFLLMGSCNTNEEKSTSVVMDKNQGLVGIALVLNTIVHPKFIQALEESIYAFLGYPESMGVHIDDEYELTFQLEFKDLFVAYEQSLMHLVKKYNPICFASMKTGTLQVGDNVLVYNVPVTGFEYMTEYNISDLIISIFKKKFDIVLVS